MLVLASVRDLDTIMSLMTTNESVTFNVTERTEVLQCLTGSGGFVLKDTEALAVLLVRYKYLRPDLLPLRGIEGVTVHLKSVVVDTDYRGKGLQRALMLHGEDMARRLGYKYAVSSVHPDNTYSLANMLKLGYVIVWNGEYYGKSPRYVMLKDIQESQVYPRLSSWPPQMPLL